MSHRLDIGEKNGGIWSPGERERRSKKLVNSGEEDNRLGRTRVTHDPTIVLTGEKQLFFFFYGGGNR